LRPSSSSHLILLSGQQLLNVSHKHMITFIVGPAAAEEQVCNICSEGCDEKRKGETIGCLLLFSPLSWREWPLDLHHCHDLSEGHVNLC
jgi:hypothetical protein